MSPPEPTREMENTISEIALALFAPGSVVNILQRAVSLAVETIDGCDACGIVFLRNPEQAASVCSSPIAADVNALQIQTGQGPGFDAVAQGGAVYATDLADDPRWPEFGPLAVAAGVRSLVACRLSAQGGSAIGFYARLPGVFGAPDRATGLTFATLAGLAITSAMDREEDERRADNLREAMRSREIIGQDQGILMERERITADQAFDTLRRASQHLNLKLREVADSLVETGEAPSTPGSGGLIGAGDSGDGTAADHRPGPDKP